ncbi:F-box/LRR-repeat protein 4 [Oryza brachyantha]|uniref:F-box domain-containing protein n=1 Tax=Oryza brachyantha TaxID=4533 RepID=J3N7R4_ORYBR|nr:F-box/LRR-repeat protein 4 [Oryza brachyantha]
MDTALCDDLLQEVFRLLPPAAAPAVSLVSRRWYALLRASITSLTLRLPVSSDASVVAPLAALLSRFPFLSALAVVSTAATDQVADAILLLVASSPSAARLSGLRFLPDSAISPAALIAASPAFYGLTSLHLTALRPLSFRWIALLPRLKSFYLVNSAAAATAVDSAGWSSDDVDGNGETVGPLPLEKLSLCGIRSGDRGLGWLWRRCGNLQWLQLRACDGTGDGPSSQFLAGCLAHLLALELRACRSVSDRVLLLAADRCRELKSLLVYDGGSREALHRFIHQRGAALRTLDLRLPLDLHNDHLLAIGAEQDQQNQNATHRLGALRLQSCVLITGDGLRSLARTATGAGIEELALVNCDVVEREPGLLTFLSQSMRRLRRLDLSYNETLTDKEVGAMLSSCHNLIDIRLRGCRCLTRASLLSLLRYRGRSMEVIDITHCLSISTADVELFAQEATRLIQMIIEESLVSEELRAIARKKGISVGSLPCD